MRLDRTDGAGAVVGPVAEAQLLMVAAGAGERGQHGRVDGRGGRVGRDRHGVVGQRAHPAAQPGWQDLLELGQGADRRLLDAGDRAAGGGAQPDCDGHSLVVV